MISNQITGIDTNGPISKRIKLANEKDLSVSTMISLVSGGTQGIEGYFVQKMEKTAQEHKSLLEEFQL